MLKNDFLSRNNYPFAGNPDAATNISYYYTTNISYYYTIIKTCKTQDVDKHACKVWILSKVAGTKITRMGVLTSIAFLKL